MGVSYIKIRAKHKEQDMISSFCVKFKSKKRSNINHCVILLLVLCGSFVTSKADSTIDEQKNLIVQLIEADNFAEAQTKIDLMKIDFVSDKELLNY